MEILIKNPKLPKRAGKANICFRDDIQEPFREKEEIYLPISSYDRSVFYPLNSNQQFLFCSNKSTVYFGGTDEKPFLVRLNPAIFFDFFLKFGEASFFQALKPPSIITLEKITGKAAKRQGDIFAAPIPSFSWRTVLTIGFLDSVEKREKLLTEPVEHKKEMVFKTRHLFTGLGLRVQLPSLGNTVFVEGLLEAPDHQNLELKRLHILSQTAYLFDPQKAD